MKRFARNLYNMMTLLGVDPRTTVRSIRGLPAYRRALRQLRAQARCAEVAFEFGRARPCIAEDSSDSGMAKGHYFHQDLLVARRIFAEQPSVHADVGSRVDGFVAHVAAFRPIHVFDIRPLSSSVPNVTFVQMDLMSELPDGLVGYCDSLSCLHALEHFGLGRYGDPVDYDGYLRGLANLHRILRQGGKLYLSVPIGPQRIEFNAHRVFSVGYLLDLLRDGFRLDHFSFVDDAGDLHEDVPITETSIAEEFGCSYGCGIFELTKA